MTEIKKAEELVAISVRQGIQMELVEADIVLGYMEGHGYALVSDEQFQVMRHDIEEEETYGYTNDQPYTIRDAVEFCQEMNEEFLKEAAEKTQFDEGYILDLRKDEFILEGLANKVAADAPQKDIGGKKMTIKSRPWRPRDLLDELQNLIDEEPDRYLNTRRTTLCMVRDFLKEHFAEQANDPFTAAELAGMVGEPIFIVPIGDNDWAPQYRICHERHQSVVSKTSKVRGYFLYPDQYGVTWMAYRHRLHTAV